MDWGTSKGGRYRIQSLSAATFPGALLVIREAFCQDEPVSIGSEVNKNPAAAEELLELCADAALDGASLVAVEINTGEIVSVAFNKLQTISTNPDEKPFFEIFAQERCTQAASRSLIKFMADVDSRANMMNYYNVDCALEIMFLATLREYRNQGLATLLCEKSIEIAERLRKGPVARITREDLGAKYSQMPERSPVLIYPKIVQAIWTAEGTQHIGKKLNFKVHLRVPFSEFVHDGKTYSERLGNPDAFCEIVAHKLSFL